MTCLPDSSPPTRRRRITFPQVIWRRSRWPIEVVAILLADLLYEWLRALAPGRRELAMAHGLYLRSLEPLGIERLEDWLNRAVNHQLPVLADTLGYYYVLLHVPVTAGVLAWLWLRRPGTYAQARTALFLVTIGALVAFWLYPVAPPRFTVPGTIDTVAQLSMTNSSAGHSAQGLVNDYAAFPSLHVAWATWCAWAVCAATRGLRRHLAWLYPACTTFAVIVTGNHYLLDIIAGAAAVGLAVLVLRPRTPDDDPGGPEAGTTDLADFPGPSTVPA
jgi:membrane-associated phospholipid phosphatase